MSRSNNTNLINPATIRYEWNGESGGFKYFDKSKGEKGERVHVPLPFTFLVLDILSTIKGYSDNLKCGFWSNEIRNTKTDELTVRSKRGIEAEGLYQTVIANRGIVGAKYCQSVYIAVYNEKRELVIANLSLVGSALSAWIEYRKKNDVYKGAIKVGDMIEKKKGKTVYFEPVFTPVDVKPETDAKAKELDAELQKYLTSYLSRNKEQVAPVSPETEHNPVDVSPPYTNDEVPPEEGNYEREIVNSPSPVSNDDDSLPF